MSKADDSVVLDFLARYVEDAENGVLRADQHYLALYPGSESVVAAELERLAQRPPTAASAVALPERIANFEIFGVLGRGGQGTVVRAKDLRLGRPVALKLVPAFSPLGGHIRAQQVHREAILAAQIDHPGICPIFEIGAEGPWCFIAMPLVPGQTLAQLLSRARDAGAAPPGALDASASFTARCRWVARFVERAARAVHASHEAGIVHRDLKPGNLMVTPDGEPVLLDFGLARGEQAASLSVTQSGDFVGTPTYASPEQVGGHAESVDHRTDIWSLGVLLYECLTLSTPFAATSRSELYRAIEWHEPVSPTRLVRGLPRDLARIVKKAIDKEPDRRYACAKTLADDLARFLRTEPVLARPAGPVLRLRRWTQRNPAVALSSISAALLLVTALVVTGWFLNREGDLRRDAEAAHHDAHRLAQAFLFDTHEALAGLPGTIEARRAVVERAMAYLEKVHASSPNDAAIRGDLIEAHLRLGDLLGNSQRANLGLPEQALANFAAALELAESGGDTVAACRVHARIGDLHKGERRRALAIASFERASALIDDLPELQAIGELGFVMSVRLRLMLEYERVGQRDRADRLLAETRQRLTAHGESAGVRRQLARWHEHKGWLLEERSRVAQALAEFEAALRIRTATTAAAQGERARLGELATSHENIARVHARQGDRVLAVREFDAALRLRRSLYERNPNDHQLALQALLAQLGIAANKTAFGDESGAHAAFVAGCELADRLAGRFPASTSIRTHQCRVRLGLGDAVLRNGPREDALVHFGAARDAARRLAAGGVAQSQADFLLASAELKLGQAFVVLSRFDEGKKMLDAGIARCEQLVTAVPTNMVYRFSLAFGLNLRGEIVSRRDPKAGQRDFAAALASSRAACGDADPTREIVEMHLAIALRQAASYRRTQQTADAAACLEEAAELAHRRLATYPDDTSLRTALANVLRDHAELTTAQGDLDAAAELRARALRELHAVIGGLPEDPVHRYRAAGLHKARATGLCELERWPEARVELRRSLELYAQLQREAYEPAAGPTVAQEIADLRERLDAEVNPRR